MWDRIHGEGCSLGILLLDINIQTTLSRNIFHCSVETLFIDVCYEERIMDR